MGNRARIIIEEKRGTYLLGFKQFGAFPEDLGMQLSNQKTLNDIYKIVKKKGGYWGGYTELYETYKEILEEIDMDIEWFYVVRPDKKTKDGFTLECYCNNTYFEFPKKKLDKIVKEYQGEIIKFQNSTFIKFNDINQAIKSQE